MDEIQRGRMRQLLDGAGVPRWAAFDPSAVHRSQYFAWVDDDGSLRGALVGPDGRQAVESLLQQCRRERDGTAERRPGSPPRDLSAGTALVLVTAGGVGQGPLLRDALRPLDDLVAFAEAELVRLLDDPAR